MKRIVYTIGTHAKKHAECALGLGRSLKFIGDTTPRVVVTDQNDHPWDKTFTTVLDRVEPKEWVFYSKLTALDRTDADQVLFIDGDGLAFQRLDDIFNYCQGKGFCVQGFNVSGGEWYGPIEPRLKRHGLTSIPRFNGGLIYYERTPECLDLLRTIREMGGQATELGFPSVDTVIIHDEPVISLAMAITGKGHLIPDHMDFSNSATGLIGKLKLDVKNNDCHFVCRRNDLRFVRPYIFHASRYINFSVYWRQLAYLEKMERYEGAHEFGYMPQYHRLERSIERRLLKLRGKI